MSESSPFPHSRNGGNGISPIRWGLQVYIALFHQIQKLYYILGIAFRTALVFHRENSA
jgi:hypothetical protein